jgi:hypothetical protein
VINDGNFKPSVSDIHRSIKWQAMQVAIEPVQNIGLIGYKWVCDF